ncbi:hypothetical protein LX32DRAFT_403400 [Colletotrichum zoysiae]|uniref:Uncharacterized protein n=1 Tax=Colletotrichum zoysiae TaxID=1216348 RepID=A0AAD9HHV7_9PEZI|nr:hypothetical protein LX32DRAFT_403400 [Colletotrichum zoysiae]
MSSKRAQFSDDDSISFSKCHCPLLFWGGGTSMLPILPPPRASGSPRPKGLLFSVPPWLTSPYPYAFRASPSPPRTPGRSAWGLEVGRRSSVVLKHWTAGIGLHHLCTNLAERTLTPCQCHPRSFRRSSAPRAAAGGNRREF